MFNGHINSLPDDIFVEIFKHFHGGYVLRYSTVCKYWKRITDLDTLWLHILEKELDVIKEYDYSWNLEMNRKVAMKWRQEFKKPLKSIYLINRRAEKIAAKYRVFKKAQKKEVQKITN